MMDNLFDQAAERIGRAYDLIMLDRSPFHLSPCGGCGGPSFGQPCALCGHYPMGGPDPRPPATPERFSQAVKNSMPGGTGNLATWYFGDFKKRVSYKPFSPYKSKVDALIAEGAGMTDLPDAEAVWKHVAVEGNSIHRPRSGAEVNSLWIAVYETQRAFDRAAEEMSRPSGGFAYVPGDLRGRADEAARLAVAAIHGDDDAWEPAIDGLSQVITDLKGLRDRWVPVGNLNYAGSNLDSIREARAGSLAVSP